MTDRQGLPLGWEWASWGDVAAVASNLVDPAGYQDALHIAPNHIEPFGGRLLERSSIGADGVSSPKHLFTKGQIIYSKIRPYLGKAVIAPSGGLCSADMYPVRTSLEPHFLLWWMLSPQFTEEVCQHQGRSLLPKINVRALNTVGVPVPPLGEQRRIADEIVRRLSHLRKAVEGMSKADTLLAATRRSVLNAVVSGALLSLDSSSWLTTSTGEVAEIRGGIQKQPKRAPVKNTRPFLRVANVGRGFLELDDVHSIEVFDGEVETYALKKGDLLVVEGNGSVDQIGRAASWDGSIHECIHQNHLIRLRPGASLDPRFLALIWNAPSTIEQLKAVASSTSGLHTLSTGKVKSVSLRLPDLQTQAALVGEAERWLSLVDAAEHSIRANLRRSMQLRRSLLHAAFAGLLVPQDPSDEPAPELIARIQSQQAAAGARPRKTKASATGRPRRKKEQPV